MSLASNFCQKAYADLSRFLTRSMLPSSLTRRKVLRVTGGTFGLSGLSGCIIGGFSDSPGGGDLVIFNSDSKEHSITVTVSKVSESDDDTRPEGETPHPQATPIWKRSERFTIPADDDLEQRDFVTEPGAYFVETELGNGDRGTYWWGLYQGSGGVAETALVLEIYNGGVFFSEGGA